MEEVSMSGQSNAESRGQLLIVTAVVIAALLLSLSMVLNMALFTEAQSTSVTFSDTARGESLKDTHITNIAQTIAIENSQMDGQAPSDTHAVIENINAQTTQRQTTYGAITSLTHDSTTSGTRIAWTNSDASLTNTDGNETWVVTDGIGEIRAYSMNFSTLPSLSDPSVAALEANAFGVMFNPSDSENATRYVYRNSGEIHITGVDETATVTTACRIPERATTTIHFTTNTLTSAGEESPCRNLWPGFDVDEIQFENGDTATGEFAYVISSGSVAPDDGGTHSEIETATAVYALTVTFDYITDDTEYTTSTRLAKGEP